VNKYNMVWYSSYSSPGSSLRGQLLRSVLRDAAQASTLSPSRRSARRPALRWARAALASVAVAVVWLAGSSPWAGAARRWLAAGDGRVRVRYVLLG
jgi:hypothetical protein